jgi:hypothetical protein
MRPRTLHELQVVDHDQSEAVLCLEPPEPWRFISSIGDRSLVSSMYRSGSAPGSADALR